MNAPVLPEQLVPERSLPERLLRSAEHPQAELPLVAPGVQRQVWESRYGPMLIEVMNGDVFVNGQRVEPHRA